MPFSATDPSTWDVLIVDNESDSIGVIELVMEYHKASVRTAVSGTECLTALAMRAPYILYLDIQMPEISGWDILKAIRSNDSLKHITVIATTAKAMMGDRERILKAGFDGYFAKPIQPLELIKDTTAVLLSRPPVSDPTSTGNLWSEKKG